MSRISPGSRVADRYAMLEELGGGGMGIVYRARDERDARDVAIKVLRHAPQGEAARRLRREARATSALDPNRVARVYDVGETPEGELYLVMEYVRGLTVRTFLNQGRLARPEALRILREVARTLGEAHRAGLVHRDVKPDNIIVCGDGRVVLLDFGIVKHMDDGDDAAKVSTQLTSEGTMLGTPAYLAPEQALGHDVGPAADQFALAVTAFEMLTGRLPWTATEVTRVLAQVLAETPPPASTIDKKLQPAFDAVLWRALSKTTTGRFATIESFARALDAADRGEYALSPASQTVGAPIAALTDAGRAGAIGAPIAALTDAGAAGPFAPSARRARWFVAGLAFLALGGAAVGLFARDHARTGLAAPSPPAPAAVLNDPGARLACPIFEVRGVPDVAGPLGAAGASLACMRAQWYLGGRHDRILPAASLLDLPTQPSEGFSDPYSAPGLRARTLELARARASAYLDGIVTREGEGWRVALSIHAADAREIARAEGDDGTILAGAVKVATERLWSAPQLTAEPIDSEVARWTGFPDAEIGRAYTDLMQLEETPEACAVVRRRARELGNVFYGIAASCRAQAPSAYVDAGLPVLDESSPAALALSTVALLNSRVPMSIDEERRLATKLDELRSHEASKLGRAVLADASGALWEFANKPDRANAALLTAAREDPLHLESWQQLVLAAADTGSTSSGASVAAAWFPAEAMFLQRTSSIRSDELDLRLHDTRLAYFLEPNLLHARQLGRALAEAGHDEEARAIATMHAGSPDPSPALESYVLAFVDLHSARLLRGLERLREAEDARMSDLVVVASVLDRSDELATKWATEFLAKPDDVVRDTIRGYVGPIVLCMRARSDLATRCLDRVSRVGHASRNWWGQGGDALLKGAQRYALGDPRGAVALWRPLIAAPSEEIARILPTEAFERAGEPELAARLDARKMHYTLIAGVSDAAPREAKRALAAGDKTRAKDLAQKVITAWEVADVSVPAVAEMRALLKSLNR